MRNTFTPTPVKLVGVSSMTCGTFFSLAIVNNTQLYSWGAGEFGQLVSL
jgi:alpha-tubulin suppressor-like RCC1 family protein